MNPATSSFLNPPCDIQGRNLEHIIAICKFYGKKRIKEDKLAKKLFFPEYFNLLVKHQESHLSYSQEKEQKKTILNIRLITIVQDQPDSFTGVTIKLEGISLQETIGGIKKLITEKTKIVPNSILKGREELDEQVTLESLGVSSGDHKTLVAIYKP
jgi:hypothetical protein